MGGAGWLKLLRDKDRHYIPYHPECMDKGNHAPGLPKDLEPYTSWIDALPEMSWWDKLWH